MKSKPDLCKSLIKYDKGPLVGKTNVLFSYGIQEDGNKSCMGYNIPHQTPQQAGVANKDKQGRLVFLCDVATLLAATGGVATKDKQGRLVFLCDVATLDT